MVPDAKTNTAETMKLTKSTFTVQEHELEQLQHYLGSENTQRIHSIDSDLHRDIFEFLLERRAICKFKQGHTLYELTTATFNGQRISGHVQNGTFLWNLGWNIRGTNFLEFIKTAFNLSNADARATLASILNMSDSFLYSTKGHLHRVAETNGSRAFKNIIPSFINTTQGTLQHVDTTYIYGYAKQLIGGIIRYKLGESIICLPASVVGGYLSIGLHQPSAFLLNQAEIDANPMATVIYCQDIRTAILLDQAAKESNVITSADIIITSTLGLDLAEVPWSYLENRCIVFVIAPNKEGYMWLESYKQHITRAGAKSFKVYPYWLLHSAKPKLEGNKPDLVQKAHYIGNVERISVFLKEAIVTAMDFKDFISWGQYADLFTTPTNISQESALNAQVSSQVLCQNMANVTGASRDYSEPVTIDDFCAPHFTSLFWGASDVGKSWFAINFCISIILGLWVFFLAPPKHRRGKHGVGYIDGEIGAVNIRPRIEQLCNARRISINEVLPNFDVLDLDGKSLLNKDVQDCILTLARDKNWKTVVIDNIQACAPEASRGRSNDFFQFIAKMKHLDINIILIHHATKEKGTHRGDGQLEDLSNCILELRAAAHDNLPDGAVVTEVIVQKCKVDGNNFKNKSAKYMLPIGGAWEFLDGDLPNYHNIDEQVQYEDTFSNELTEVKKESVSVEKYEELVQALNPQEEELFNFLKKNKKITRQMVQDAFMLETRTAGNRIKKLVDKGLIIMNCEDGNKNTYYTITQ